MKVVIGNILLLTISIAIVCGQQSVDDFRESALEAHNEYRALHQVGPLSLNGTLNDIAQEVAVNLANIKQLIHSGSTMNGEKLGENLASTTNLLLTGKSCTDDWYSEVKNYDYNADGMDNFKSGHFSQLVWKSSTLVGFGFAQNGDYSVGVGLYYPMGNIIGTYKENVFPPKSKSIYMRQI